MIRALNDAPDPSPPFGEIFLAALLAFLSALLVEYLWMRYEQSSNRRGLLQALRSEAERNRTSVISRGLDAHSVVATVEIYDTAVWASALADGRASLLPAHFSISAARIYARIDSARKWDLLYTESLLRKDVDARRMPELRDNVVASRKGVVEAIDNYLDLKN